MRHISGSHNKRRSPAKNWLKKIDRYCSIAKIPRDRPHTASTKPSTFEGFNVMDSRWWQAKKRTSKEDMAQNIPGRPDESQHHMGRGWTHCNGSSCLASRCPMCLLAREELRLNTKQMKLQKNYNLSRVARPDCTGEVESRSPVDEARRLMRLFIVWLPLLLEFVFLLSAEPMMM